MAPQLDSFFKQVDSLTDHFIDRLRKAVAIPSVSADEERRPDVVKVGFQPKNLSSAMQKAMLTRPP
jgi:Cys-Gly metallodipeptidase DUG1